MTTLSRTVTMFLLVFSCPVDSDVCPDKWKAKFGSCYLYMAMPGGMSINNARAACEGLGAALAQINNEAENEFISSMRLIPARGFLAVGATDVKKEGVFLWGDGTPAVYTNWKMNEPNDMNGQDCVRQSGNDAGSYYIYKTWDDYSCTKGLSNRDGFICQKLQSPPPTLRNQLCKLRSRNQKSSLTVMASSTVRTLSECATLCVTKNDCMSFNICRVGVTKRCETLTSDLADSLVDDSNCDHYYLQSKSYE